MSDLPSSRNTKPADVHRAVMAILTVLEDEDKVVAVMALSGCLGNLANDFKQPQAVLDYALGMATDAMRDGAALGYSEGKMIN